jgi:hypothetical protein
MEILEQKGKTFTILICIFAAKFEQMKKWFAILLLSFLLTSYAVHAQCSICTKTASQLGEKPAKGLNSGILYLMFAPLAIGGFIGYRWWQREKSIMKEEAGN